MTVLTIGALVAGTISAPGTASAAPAHHHHRHHRAAPVPIPKSKPLPEIRTGPRIPQRLMRYAGSSVSAKKFRAGPYLYPRGWFYHRWSFGERLPDAFFVSRYWIAEYGQLGLIEPPKGYVWVRVDTDAVLVNMDSGEVLHSVYDVFF